MAEQWYSLKEIAKELNTTWQSIRSWKEQYYQFVPMEAEGKHARFKKEALEVFQFIQEAKENGLDYHDIRKKLESKFGQAKNSLAEELQVQLSQQQDVILVDSKVVEDMKDTILLLQKEINDLKMKWQEVEIAKRDQTLMDNLNKIRDKKKKGIWSRVMNFTF